MTRFLFSDHKNVQVGSDPDPAVSVISYPPGSGSWSLNQDYRSGSERNIYGSGTMSIIINILGEGRTVTPYLTGVRGEKEYT